MENLITSSNDFLSLMPLVIAKFTSVLKPFLPKDSKFIPFLPYIIWVWWMLWMYLVFNEKSIWIYIFNWLWIALSATWAYEEWKKQSAKKDDVVIPSIHDTESIDDIG